MKENKYDDQAFFDRYQKQMRSQLGLEGAEEWKDFQKLLPPLKDKDILDLGCGHGWHCIYAMDQGAYSVTGVDISQKMLDVAMQKTQYKQVKYICSPMEDIQFEDKSFDVVISSLAFHYIEDFNDLIIKISKCLKDKGQLVFSAEHPISSSTPKQDWIYDDKGNVLHFPVDNYFMEGKKQYTFLGHSVNKAHRTLTTYMNTLINNGFEITQIIEPCPSQKIIDKIPKANKAHRRPLFIIISAMKS